MPEIKIKVFGKVQYTGKNGKVKIGTYWGIVRRSGGRMAKVWFPGNKHASHVPFDELIGVEEAEGVE